MKHTIYSGIEFLTKKQVITAVATEKRAVRAELADYAHAIEYAFKQLTANGSQARNSANACKGVYKTALQVVVNCYPYQTASGELCTRTRDGYRVRKLHGRACAGAIVSKSVQNYIDYRAGRKSALVEIVTPISE